MNRIALVTEDHDYVTRTRSLSEELDAEVVGFTPRRISIVVAQDIMGVEPDIVLLGPGLKRARLAELTTDLADLDPTLAVVWIAEDSPLTWRHALKSGATDVISSTATSTEFVTLIRASLSFEVRPQATKDDDPEEVGRIVAVVSPKGGSGKTMLSSNIAAALSTSADRGVVLIDLDLQFGDVASALGIRPEYSVLDVLRAKDDELTSKTFLTSCQPGMFALAAPPNPVEAEDADPESVAKLLAMLRSEFSYVIVDTGAGLDETTLTAIEEASDLVMVTTCDVASIHALRKLVVVLDQLHLNRNRRWVVVNRSTSKTGVSPTAMAKATGLQIDIRIPADRAISRGLNHGRPLMIDPPRSKASKALIAAAKMLHDDRPSAPARGR